MGFGRMRGARQADASVQTLEGRRLMAASAAGVYPFGGAKVASLADGDGTVVKFALAAGKGAVTVGDDGIWHVGVSQGRSGTLGVSSKGGDGRMTAIADLTAAKGLGTLDVSKAGLSGSVTISNVQKLVVGRAADLAVTSTSALAEVRADSWVDRNGAADDALVAPSVGALRVTGNFAPAVTLSSKKVGLASATVGGTVAGAWAVAGSAGTLKFHALRSPDLTVSGSVTSLTLDDFVTTIQGQNATGGVVHVGKGVGSVSAGRGADRFTTPKNVTLYTSTADLYSWNDLYQYDKVGRRWKYTIDGKNGSVSVTSAYASRGRTYYGVQSAEPDGTQSQSYTVDGQGRARLASLNQSDVGFGFSDLLISARYFRIGQSVGSSSPATMHGSDGEVSANLSGSASYNMHVYGHELVRTPAGTFLALKLGTSLSGKFSGTVTNGVQSFGIKGGERDSATEWFVPGLGEVRWDMKMTVSGTIEGQQTQDDNSSEHAILTKAPTT